MIRIRTLIAHFAPLALFVLALLMALVVPVAPSTRAASPPEARAVDGVSPQVAPYRDADDAEAVRVLRARP